MSAPITDHADGQDNKLAPAGICLDLRNERLSIDRPSLLELPESILLVLFPNGVVLNTQPVNEDGQPIDEEDVYFVDFDKACLEYILKFYDEARIQFYGTAERQPDTLLSYTGDPSSPTPSTSSGVGSQSPLFQKQAIIVLREELEYFVVPPKKAFPFHVSHDDGFPTDEMLNLKRICGEFLHSKKSIFMALQRNVNRENNVAEQHLIDMLCMSGFERDDKWGYRAIEPMRTCITSLALVLLKTGISQNNQTRKGSNATERGTANSETEQNGADPATASVNTAQLAIAQKLLLFWRKPARKCWWDVTEVDLLKETNAVLPQDMPPVKLWTRRVWTLELSLV